MTRCAYCGEAAHADPSECRYRRRRLADEDRRRAVRSVVTAARRHASLLYPHAPRDLVAALAEYDATHRDRTPQPRHPATTAPAWVPCWNGCGEFLCMIHRLHVSDCDCPAIEDWEVDPYVEGGPLLREDLLAGLW